MNRKRSLFFASLLGATIIWGCQERPKSMDCKAQLDSLALANQAQLDLANRVSDSLRATITTLTTEVSVLHDSIAHLHSAHPIDGRPDRRNGKPELISIPKSK